MAASKLRCTVWWSKPLIGDERTVALLDPAERERHGRFLRPVDAARFATGRAVAKTVLAQQVGIDPAEVRFTTECPHCAGNHGKPRMAGTDVDLSISHSGDLVAVGMVVGAVLGVDVEQTTTRQPGNLPVEALAPRERAVLQALPADQRVAAFFTYWTRKEALLKATGHGLAAGMDTFTVSAPNEHPELLEWASGKVGPGPVRLHTLSPDPDHQGCVAVLTDRDIEVVEAQATEVLGR
ncbi:4'-phosphopantetheinyl transferase family protein [Goodfellowiella coeruleoviolacea]|uniref:4'-phosphopantetheinyl transferase family protein n=1 Tax=Goodfellowiella coeruleoviolacea TaxID=334858 RepID=UPI000AAFA2F5|nr:4'-phosphopantetheinyl transferase superfamily protein [Goodfellowiella coeruleoviolacea]